MRGKINLLGGIEQIYCDVYSTMSNGNALLESSCGWFLESYEYLKHDLKYMNVIDSSSITSLMKLVGEGNYNEKLNGAILKFGNKIVDFDYYNSLFRSSVNLTHNSFLLLLDKISTYSIKVEAIKERFVLLQNSLKALTFLHEKIRNFINNTVVGPDLINKIMHNDLDMDYYIPLKCVVNKFDLLRDVDTKRTNIKGELCLLYRSLLIIAINRLKYEISSIFSNNESIFTLIQAESSNSILHSELMKKSKIIKFLISNTTDFKFFEEKYIIFIKRLFSQVVIEIEKLCEHREPDALIVSKEYDKYSLSIYEREKILNNFYLLIGKPLNNTFFSTPNTPRIEEIFFKSQNMIYKAFISIYEHSKQLFDNSLRFILLQIFSEHFARIMELFQLSILKTNDTIGLSIIYNILFRFNNLSESKFKVFSNAIIDSNVLFDYYKKQNKSIYVSLETSVIHHLHSLSSLSSRDLIKMCVTDKPSHINPITRRISDLLIILSKLLDEPNTHSDQIRKLMRRVQTSLTNWLELSSELLQKEHRIGNEEGYIFIINNVDAIISALKGKNGVYVDHFQDIFRDYTQKYIESRLIGAFSGMQKIIDSDISSDEIDIQYICETFEYFNNSWRKKTDIELQTTLTSFSNFHTSEEILRLLGTTIAMKYSKFVNIIKNKHEISGFFEKNKVDVEEILNYIQKCLYPINTKM